MVLTKSMGIHLNDSRVSRIITAESLGDAQYMGVVDRITDWFRGGVKKEAIQRAWNVIGGDFRPELKNKNSHEKMLHDYAFVRLSTRAEFCSNVNLRIASDWDTGKWSYEVRLQDSGEIIGELAVEDIDIGDGITLAGFMDYEELLGLNDLLSRYNPDADRSESLARIHEKLMNINMKLSHSGKELWSCEAYSDKHDLIIGSLPELGVDSGFLDSISLAEPRHLSDVDTACVFTGVLNPEHRISDNPPLIWPADDIQGGVHSNSMPARGRDLGSERCADAQLSDRGTVELVQLTKQ